MPPVAVCSVKSPRVSGQQRLQHPRRRSLLDFQEQMEVVRHQNVGVEVKRITLSHHRQTVEKRFVVAVLKKYLAPVVASGHHVIEQSLCMDSGMSGHKALISKLVDLGKSDTVTLHRNFCCRADGSGSTSKRRRRGKPDNAFAPPPNRRETL